jgi:hypothetical protein
MPHEPPMNPLSFSVSCGLLLRAIRQIRVLPVRMLVVDPGILGSVSISVYPWLRKWRIPEKYSFVDYQRLT